MECLIKIIFFRDWVKVLIFNEIRHKNCCFFFQIPLFFFTFADSKVQDKKGMFMKPKSAELPKLVLYHFFVNVKR